MLIGQSRECFFLILLREEGKITRSRLVLRLLSNSSFNREVATRLGQFQQLLKTRVILILNYPRPHAITYRKRATRAARLFFLIQPIKSLICGVVIAASVVIS